MAGDQSCARPAPVPCDIQAKGWRFELDMEQVRQSDTWALASPAARPWLLMLWAVAWEQKPCGSLPDDDELIAARIGMDLDTFASMKRVLLRGWWRADDGRLYHDTIVERVQAMLAKKEKDRQRKAGWRARHGAPSRVEDEPVTPESRGTDTSVTPESDRSDDTKHQAPSTSSSLRSEEEGGSAQTPTPPHGDTQTIPKPKARGADPPPDFLGDANAEALNGRHVAKLAAGWELPEQWGMDAEALGWKPSEIIREAEKFRQYWVSGKGAGTRRSVKGWRQSWSNWLSKAERFKA